MGVVLRNANTREDEFHSLGTLNIVEYVSTLGLDCDLLFLTMRNTFV